MSGYRLTRIRRNALPDAVNNMLAGAKVGDTLSLTVYGEPSDVVITELDNEWFEGRHTPRPEPARPVGGDTREALREEIVRVYRTWPGDTSFTAELFADAVLALPAVRTALDAQEKLRRVEAALDALGRETGAYEASYKGWAQTAIRDVRRALDGAR